METIRAIILTVGWPILIVGSIILVYKSIRFYQEVEKNVVGRLVLLMVIGWFVSMYSLGIVATAYMFSVVRSGVLVVLPIFFVWFVTMAIITWAVLRWSNEAVTLSAFYRELEALVKKRTQELKDAYELQLKQEKELRELREKFVFIAAHELRSPVTTMEWGLRTLLEDNEFYKSLSSEYRKLLKDIHERNETLIELINDLLNVSRLEGDTLDSPLEEVSLKDILLQVKESVNRIAQNADVTLAFEALEQELPLVRSNSLYLKEVFINFITNAIRYNKPGGWVRIKADIKPKELIAHIQDSGIGMSEEEMAGLFKEFYRVKTIETQDIEGTGLGLFITKKLLERMHGEIWVSSVKGQGSTFSFSLPLSHKLLIEP